MSIDALFANEHMRPIAEMLGRTREIAGEMVETLVPSLRGDREIAGEIARARVPHTVTNVTIPTTRKLTQIDVVMQIHSNALAFSL